ncbi:YtcA family lipoprotein [Pseudochrobactrum sp. AO18b]|uniref:YtcA family lipoprotein n=1 Tax=Pseudochrobactrum sp. AO18b TaxID=1201036 RepID=UPI000488BA8E
MRDYKLLSSPSFYIFGAFFPSWMLCLFLALIIVLMLRVIFIRTGLDDLLTFKLTAYTAMVIAIACAMSLVVYGR